jgi:hypothetical protein
MSKNHLKLSREKPRNFHLSIKMKKNYYFNYPKQNKDDNNYHYL